MGEGAQVICKKGEYEGAAVSNRGGVNVSSFKTISTKTISIMSSQLRNDWLEKEIIPHELDLKMWLKRAFPKMDSCIDDIIQESYIRVLKAHEKRKIEIPRAYLYRTARHVAYDFIRKSSKRKMESFDDHPEISDGNDSNTAKRSLDREYELKLLKEAIKTLPKKCREIFVLRKIKCLTNTEIGERLGISVNTVSAQLTIGLRKCTEYVEEVMGREIR